MTSSLIEDINLYDLLEILPDADEKQIKKAYRKKALSCHPDKNPDNPAAVQLFHQLSKALEILADIGARAAYDRVLKAKKATELRKKSQDSKRQKLREDLEARERAAADKTTNTKAVHEDPAARLRAEIDRLRRDGSAQLRREQEILREQLKQDLLEQSLSARIKVTWNPSHRDYSENELNEVMSRYGDINAVIMSTKQGRALVEFKSRDCGAAAYRNLMHSDSLKLTWLQGPAPELVPETVIVDHPSARPQVPTSNSDDFEAMVLQRMKQRAQQAKLKQTAPDDGTG